MRSRARLGWLAAAALLAAGCASTTYMMPPPVAYREGLLEPFPLLAPEDATREFPVFYATDRAPDPESPCGYGDRRGDVLRLGVARVAFGEEDWTWDQIAERSVSGEKVPIACVARHEHGRLWTTIPRTSGDYAEARASTSAADPIRAGARAFAEAVDAKLARSAHPDVYVFVSGFNTSFAETVERIGQLGHFLSRDGVFLAYAWPTRRKVLGYVGDVESGAISARNLRELLIFLSRETRARRIHVIGYSAGAQVLARALVQVRLRFADDDAQTLRRRLRFGHALFPAPDLDLMYARNLELDDVGDLFDAVTIYLTAHDLGVWASGFLYFKYPRLGNPGRELDEAEQRAWREGARSALVDPEQAQRHAGWSDFASHGYWYLNPWVSSDAMLFLRFGLPPAERGLVRDEDEAVWQFPEDYPQRLERVLGEIRRRLEPQAGAGPGAPEADPSASR